MDDATVQEIRAWLVKGLEDLKSAEWLLSSPDELYGSVGFHCQQVAEKALKAYLTWSEKPFEKTHSLVALVGECLLTHPSFNQLRTAATTLNPYAVALRYPGDMLELSEVEAREALALAREVWEFVLERIPSIAQAEM